MSSLVSAATANGFNCAQCGRFIVRTPVRSNDFGPFFCTFLCAFDFRAARGDSRAADNAQRIRNLFNR